MKAKRLSTIGWLSAALTLPAAADIIYSNLKDISTPANFAGVYLNVETGAWNTNINSPQSGWDINPFFGGSVLWNSPTFQPVRSGTSETDSVVKLAEGSSVSGSSVFSTFTWNHDNNILTPEVAGYGASETHMGAGSGQFTAGQEGYFGFRLNDSNYGYMRVVFTDNTGGALIKEWAYDDSGGSIVVGNVKRTGSDVALDSSNGDFSVGSVIANAGGTTNLVKTGTGTATLNGTSTYSGTTTVSAGTLLINGALTDTSSTTVSSGATLGGTGSIANSVTIASGGFVSPGDDSIESLGLGSLDLDGTLLIEWDTTVSPNIDLLNIAGTLNLGSNSAITFTNLGAGSLDLNTPYVFASYGPGGLTGTFSSVNLLPVGFTLDYNYGGLNQIAIVPEPSSLLVTVLLSLPMVLRRKRG